MKKLLFAAVLAVLISISALFCNLNFTDSGHSQSEWNLTISEVRTMTAKEYLEQVYYLDSRIRSNLQELADLRKMMYSVSSPSLEQSYNPNRPTEAPFVRGIESMDILERQSKQKLTAYSKSKKAFAQR